MKQSAYSNVATTKIAKRFFFGGIINPKKNQKNKDYKSNNKDQRSPIFKEQIQIFQTKMGLAAYTSAKIANHKWGSQWNQHHGYFQGEQLQLVLIKGLDYTGLYFC